MPRQFIRNRADTRLFLATMIILNFMAINIHSHIITTHPFTAVLTMIAIVDF
jgi:hypothetical protein